MDACQPTHHSTSYASPRISHATSHSQAPHHMFACPHIRSNADQWQRAAAQPRIAQQCTQTSYIIFGRYVAWVPPLRLQQTKVQFASSSSAAAIGTTKDHSSALSANESAIVAYSARMYSMP